MTDDALEAAIDRAGRDKVFALIRSYGWQGPLPKWMWWEAVRMVEAQ
jgi:hypothetical protein